MVIKAIAMDVDGVVTDGTVWLDGDGRELKRVSFADVMGVSIGRRAGLSFVFVSGESGDALRQIANKFGITEVHDGCRDKAKVLRDYASSHGLDLREVCFIGDDVNDVPAFELCGLAAAPADAHPAALAKAKLVTKRPGGRGAVREVIDTILTPARSDVPPGERSSES